jgi:hypothetical protein
VSGVSPFRLFGRPPEPEPALERDDEGVAWAPGPWDREPAPATRHARPVAFGHGADPVGRGFAGSGGLDGGITGGDGDDDPPTDPHGFPPIPAEPAVAWGAPRAVAPRPVPRALDPAEAAARTLDPAEVAALAGAFAADYLSWDEDDPARRGRALADHLATPVGDPTLLGWDGRGRQRAELALPGLVRPDGDDRVLVDVRVRVTPYRAVGDGGTRPATGLLGPPASSLRTARPRTASPTRPRPSRTSSGCPPRPRRPPAGAGAAARRTGCD